MPTLRPEVKKKWTEALRSGRYTQGKDSLRDVNDNFCCLGVLCDIAKQEGVIPEPWFSPTYDEWNYGKVSDSDSRSGTLPVSVQDWAYADFDPEDKQLSDPELGDKTASDWNDSYGADFNKIANLIEEYL